MFFVRNGTMSSLDEIKDKLNSYKKKYYTRQLIIGSLVFFTLTISTYLILGFLEYSLWMNSLARSVVFFTFVLLTLGLLFFLIVEPILRLVNLKRGIEDETAAYEIARFFPEVEDRLLNLLQLGKQSSDDNALIGAAITTKASEFKTLSFAQAVQFSNARKYGILLGTVIVCLFLVSFINPEIVGDSPKRIANYNQHFEREAPFQFEIINERLESFKGEDFTFLFKVVGSAIPEKVNIKVGRTSSRLVPDKDGNYSFTFDRMQESKVVQLEAGGFFSRPYEIRLFERPDLVSMNIIVQNPTYTGGERKVITNGGDLTVMEGSSIRWELNALSTDNASIKINKDTFLTNRASEQQFVLEKRVFRSGHYDILLQNDYSLNKSDLSYDINVIKDLFPKINAEFFPDSSTYEFITVAGSISDDYGFSRLTLNYRKDTNAKFESIPLELTSNASSQSFYANWSLDSLDLKAGSRLEVYVSVADNDQVNGYKVAKSQSFIMQIPTEGEIDNLLTKKTEGVENQLDKAKEEAESISEKLSEIEDRLKSEQKFDWQEKKMLEDVIEDREELNKQIEQLQKEHNELLKSNQQFRKQSSQLQEKNQMMQELLEELMDEETWKLYEKLKELMRENAPQDQISEQLQQLSRSENNLERDLERAVELFKRLKMETALEENLQKLDTLSNQQEEIAADNTDEQSLENAQKQQEQVQEQFNDFREKMDEVMEMNQDLKRPEAMDDFEYEERQIAKELREIMEEMERMMNESKDDSSNDVSSQESSEQSEQNGESQKNDSGEQENSSQQQNNQNRQGLQQKQKNAAQKMKSLSQKLNTMQGGMQMEMMQANLDQLRDILDNLVKLSFNQEEIMNEMREVNQSDPRFLELSQNQLKLKDDAKVIQDSLLSLASKVVQISSFVTREVDKINESIDETIDFLKDRNRGRAITSQQFAMTSINNLALLLDDTMQQMQMAMSEAMGQSSGEKQQSKGLPDLQELQNQLGEKMNELKGSGKTGRELSEELARLAAEQELIRRQLEMLKEAEEGRPGGQAGDDLQRAIDMMEQNEVDLVNKRLTQQLINRQKQIQTRLLEAEKAQREQETEEEREAEQPGIITREIPPEFEEYLKLKKKEIELLKTIPVELNPFYKKEVNDYFRRISKEEE